jgi:hypothetical protein
MKALKILRQANETAVSLNGLCPDVKVPQDLIQEGKKAALEGVGDRSGLFYRAKLMDSINEGLPCMDSLDDL